jgi:hypothetical protein
MDIINPFEELVVFGKAFPLEPTGSTALAALRPTGRHLGHGGDLTYVRGKASGGKQPQIERYTTSPKGLREGPFHGTVKQPRTKVLRVTGSGKGFRTGPFGKAFTAAPSRALNRGGVSRSLQAIADIPKPTLKPTGKSWKQPIAGAVKKNSNIPSGASQGSRL